MAVVSDSKIAEEHTLNRIGVKSESFSVGYPPKPSCNGQIQRWEFPKVAWNQNSSICAVFYRHLGWAFPDLARTPQGFASKLYAGRELWYCGTELSMRILLSVVKQHKKKAAKKQITSVPIEGSKHSTPNILSYTLDSVSQIRIAGIPIISQ